MKKVAIIMGSDSDLPIVQKAADSLKEYGVPYEMRVMSAHRCPEKVAEYSRRAEENGIGVIIAAAGMAAHLAGAIAANTTLPVIGRAPCHGTDAFRYPRRHSGNKQRQKRGDTGGSDAGAVRRGAFRKTESKAHRNDGRSQCKGRKASKNFIITAGKSQSLNLLKN